MSIQFVVYGKPAQMGSKKAFIPKGWKRAIITDDNSDKRKQWAGAVSQAAAEAMQGRELFTGGLMLTAKFFLRRPKAHFGSGKNASVMRADAPPWHIQAPDLDKLVRCLKDALSGVVYRDDSQVCSLGETEKNWTTAQERCEITVVPRTLTPLPEVADERVFHRT